MSCRRTSFYYDKFAWELVKDPCVRREILKLIKSSGGSGSVSITGGAGINITGTGTPSDPYIISLTGSSGLETFEAHFTSDGSNPTDPITALIDSSLLWFEVEDIPYTIGDEVTLDSTTGVLTIPGGIGNGQRVKLLYKK